ncbi:MAG TPA: thiazole synthase [Fibrobacteres bacterium]|jgi:thiazole synthase|nr:thiazole synthase [Fibrobacterota bacterium]
MIHDKPLVIGGRTYRSRLIIGTGKYPNFEIMRQAHEASGAEMVTVALGRVKLGGPEEENILNFIDTKKYALLPNTAGAFNVEDALRIARLARAQGMNLIKLEVLSEAKTLLPDPFGTYEAAKKLVEEEFTVLVYTNDDPVLAKKLEDLGVAAVMPAGSPIGSGQGVLNANNIRIIMESLSCPVIVDAGMGTASDLALAMELGVDGILCNTGIACAQDPVRMARAFRAACEAGRESFLAGRIPRKLYGSASSPLEGLR